MKKFILIAYIIIAGLICFSQEDYVALYKLCRENKPQLKEMLNEIVSFQKYLSYTEARYQMFTYIDNNNGIVHTIYSDEEFYTDDIPNANNYNCEHTIPQSKFGNSDKSFKKTDLHHLRPCKSKINSTRGNYPYGIVKTIYKQYNGSYFGKDEQGRTVFEPRDEIKGDIARGIFYFSIRYNWEIDDEYETMLRQWHKQDKVSEIEYDRNCRVEDVQGNRNPFIDCPDFVDDIEDF